MDPYVKLLLSNEAWVKEKLALRRDFFQRAVHGQKPRFLWIGCSDSRVPPGDVTGSRSVAFSSTSWSFLSLS